jgi:hypothetical protein
MNVGESSHDQFKGFIYIHLQVLQKDVKTFVTV